MHSNCMAFLPMVYYIPYNTTFCTCISGYGMCAIGSNASISWGHSRNSISSMCNGFWYSLLRFYTCQVSILMLTIAAFYLFKQNWIKIIIYTYISFSNRSSITPQQNQASLLLIYTHFKLWFSANNCSMSRYQVY